MRNISIINHSIISKDYYRKAIDLCKDIDIDDAVFVAYAICMNAKLWTGDKKLMNGLLSKNFKKLIDTNTLYNDFMKCQKLARNS